MSQFITKSLIYHPASLFEEKRRQQDALKEAMAAAESQTLAEIDPATGKPKEKEEDAISRAKRISTTLVGAMQKLKSHYESLIQLCTSAQNSALDDLDRKELNKKFQKAKADIDEIALKTEVDGARIFSGDYAEQGFPIVVDPDAGESGAILMQSEAVTCEALGITRLRVDSLVNARKTQQELEENARKVVSALTSLEGKCGSIDFQIRKIQDKQNDGQGDQAGDNKRSKDGDSPYGISSLMKSFVEDNRRAQERAHRMTQEIAGLLVNRRI